MNKIYCPKNDNWCPSGVLAKFLARSPKILAISGGVLGVLVNLGKCKFFIKKKHEIAITVIYFLLILLAKTPKTPKTPLIKSIHYGCPSGGSFYVLARTPLIKPMS